MSAINNQPTNNNPLSPLGFKFIIKKTPNVNWFIQSVDIPSISLPRTDVSNPFIQFPVGGDHLTYGDFRMVFRVDEDMKNYIELYNWINGIGFPDNFDQYKELSNQPTMSGQGIYSDATLLVLNSSFNPNIELQFTDLFPISLSELTFDLRMQDVRYIDCTATFAYRKFNITPLT
jgi:hypothetical protein